MIAFFFDAHHKRAYRALSTASTSAQRIVFDDLRALYSRLYKLIGTQETQRVLTELLAPDSAAEHERRNTAASSTMNPRFEMTDEELYDGIGQKPPPKTPAAAKPAAPVAAKPAAATAAKPAAKPPTAESDSDDDDDDSPAGDQSPRAAEFAAQKARLHKAAAKPPAAAKPQSDLEKNVLARRPALAPEEDAAVWAAKRISSQAKDDFSDESSSDDDSE
jgi:hypothetical protein